MAKYVATHIEIGGKKISFPDPVEIRIPAKGELCGFFRSPEIGREITDPDEIRIAVLAAMPLDNWLKCIRVIRMPIFTSKQWGLIRWNYLSL